MDYKLVKLNSARSALRYVIKSFGIKEIYIPYYICPVIRNAVKQENCKIVFYHVDKNFKPIIVFPKNAFILYPNYFGVCSKNVEELVSLYPNLIVDNAHSFYSEPKGIASFNSLRKFFPTLQDGSFLYTLRTCDESFDVDKYEYENKVLSFEELIKNENRLDNEGIKLISPTTLGYFNNINLIADKQMRIEKFKLLNQKYGNSNVLNLTIAKNDIPFSYPYLATTVDEADKIVSSLNKEVYRYWTNLPDSFEEKIFYTNLVSIPF